MGEDLSQLRESLRNSFSKIKEDILSHESKINKLVEENKKILLSIQKISFEIKKKPSAPSKSPSKEIVNIKSQVSSIEKNIKKIYQSQSLQKNIPSYLEDFSNTFNNKIKKIEKRITDLRAENIPPEHPVQQKFESLIHRLEEKINTINISKNNEPQIHSIVGEAVKQAVSSLSMSQDKSHKKETETPFAHKMMKKIERNKKGIIKQKILDILSNSPVPLPELKEVVVDEKQYCSKASFYRYIEDLSRKGVISFSKKKDQNMVILKDKSLSF